MATDPWTHTSISRQQLRLEVGSLTAGSELEVGSRLRDPRAIRAGAELRSLMAGARSRWSALRKPQADGTPAAGRERARGQLRELLVKALTPRFPEIP